MAAKGPARASLRYAKAPLSPRYQWELHQLLGHCSKYVALATENGMLSVSWEIAQVERGNIVQVLWQERDGPEVEKTASAGFGMKLIERACIYELGGSVELRFAPEGLSAMIKFPIPVDRTLSER